MAVRVERVGAHYMKIAICKYKRVAIKTVISSVVVSQLQSRHVFGRKDNVTVMVTLLNVRHVRNWVISAMSL